MFKIETQTGHASIIMPEGDDFYMDAARSGNLLGMEFVAGKMTASDESPNLRPAALMVNITMRPYQGERMLLMLAEKLGMPAFNELQWKLIRGALGLALANSLDNPGVVAELRSMSDTIKAAYGE